MNIFSNKKVTIGKKVIAWTIAIVVLLCSLSFFYILYMINKEGNLLGEEIGSEIVALSFFVFLPSISFIMILENTIVRWFKIVEKYQKNKIGGNKK
ncbi:hypothetical protein ER578_12725 [Enterococcus faecium]|uniref:hypothetical protein n=1 Tax=Enterococcus faecium TaxID=1352 RepID=UPI000CF312EE|nr:hypothetical protein [Enterococcus faecium]EKK5253782.1 hypothetical protein [Enterococcus faecalis]EGP5129897.1 hypothetical protein [Enterococcus faecium]EME7094051.1 hypothetical protein [Enterococcus faecium]EME7139638.1 hypothetical protein [Enterococcus faecium]EME8119959.1 hypothetical protein [Enterococcus faecium]